MVRTLTSLGHDGGVRRFTWFALLGLVLVACGGRGDTASRGPVTFDNDSASTTTTVAGAPSEGGDAGADGAGAPAATTAPPSGRAPSTTLAAGRASPSTTAAADVPTPTTAAPGAASDDGHRGPPGAYARTLLRPRPATSVVVERFQQRGKEPSAAALASARSTLAKVTNKNVDVRDPLPLDGTGGDWSADELRSLADRVRRVDPTDSRAVLELLFVGGTFEGSSSVLGVTVRGDVIVIFEDSVQAATTPVLSGSTIEEAVLIHEFGHALGLVDLARDTGRADREHPGHSTNPRSVMYWAVESDLIGQVLTGPPPREFDAADLADLQALRDGA